MHKPLFSQKGLPRMLRYIKCTCGTVCHKCMKCQWLYRVAAYVKSGTGAVKMSPGSDRNPCVSPKSHFTLQQQHCNQKIEADRVSLASVCPLIHLVQIVDSVRVRMYMWKRKRACIYIYIPAFLIYVFVRFVVPSPPCFPSQLCVCLSAIVWHVSVKLAI